MEIKVPEVGESVFEAEIGKWHKKDGDHVSKDDLLCELETDKISLELNAATDGILRIKVREGETVEVGAVIGEIEEGGEKETEKDQEEAAGKTEEKKKPSAGDEKEKKPAEKKEKAEEEKEKPGTGMKKEKSRESAEEVRPGTAAKGGKEPRADGEEERFRPSESPTESTRPPQKREDDERTSRERMSPLRRKIAERLLAARQQTAMLTTFNEADLSRVLALRRKHGPDFEKKHGIALGFMSFFVKASVEALREFPEVNARIDGDDIVYQHFYDIGIAIGGDKGLVVPILRDADQLPFARIEQGIRDFVDRIKSNKLNLADLEGGTFTISNGGVYGSLLSTPILNPPQSAVLGMHAIQQRPVVRDEQIVPRPMMYLALSYDHRIIDGRQAVTFLKRIKDLVEEPEEMLLEL